MPSPETGSCPPPAVGPTRGRRDACDVPPRLSDESARIHGPERSLRVARALPAGSRK
jgi:hypothetical protein